MGLAVAPVNSRPTFELPDPPELVINQDSWCVESPSAAGPGLCSYTAQVYSPQVEQRMHVRRNFASNIRMGGSSDPYEVRAARTEMLNGINVELQAGEGQCPEAGVGPYACSQQQALFNVTAVDPMTSKYLFLFKPRLYSDGSLVFNLRQHAVGKTRFRVTLSDDGGGISPAATSVEKEFTIELFATNTPPTFDLVSTDIQVPPFALAQEVRHFLQNISVGPEDEKNQTFVVSVHLAPEDHSRFAADGLPRYRRYEDSLFFIPAAPSPVEDPVSIALQVEMQDSGGNMRSSAPGWYPWPVGSDNKTTALFNITFMPARAAGGASTWQKMTTGHLPLAADGAKMSPRRGHAVVEFLGDIWVLGGYMTPQDNASKPWSGQGSRRLLSDHKPEYMLADVWRFRQVAKGICRDDQQEDLCLGQSLEQPQAAWAGRHSHAAVVMGGRMWVMGGFTATAITRDVWSSYDGVVWTEVTTHANWSPRFSMAIETIANPGTPEDPGIFVLTGGGTYTGDGVVHYNDVWTSADGANWNLLTASSSWTPRARHAMAALRDADGKVTLLLAGGESVNGDTVADVWYSADNGASWILGNALAPWKDRAGHAMLRYRGKVLVVAGRSSVPVNVDVKEPIRIDVWQSSDGSTWEQPVESIVDSATREPCEGREDFGMVVHSATGRLVIIGGQGVHGRLGDVWVSS